MSAEPRCLPWSHWAGPSSPLRLGGRTVAKGAGTRRSGKGTSTSLLCRRGGGGSDSPEDQCARLVRLCHGWARRASGRMPLFGTAWLEEPCRPLPGFLACPAVAGFNSARRGGQDGRRGGCPKCLDSLRPLSELLQAGGLEVSRKREDCAGPCQGVCGEKGGGGGRGPDPPPHILHSALRLPGSLNPLDPPHPASPLVPPRALTSVPGARSSWHWLGSRLSQTAAVTLRLGL